MRQRWSSRLLLRVWLEDTMCRGVFRVFKKLYCIKEYASTPYVGLARAVSPTNTNFRLTFFTNPTSGGSLWRLSCIEHQIWRLPSLFWPLILSGSQFLAPVKNRQFLRFIHNNNTNNNNYHNNLLQFGFLGVYWSDRYITYTLVTNFPEIVPFIIGFCFTVWTKKSAKKILKQVRGCLQNLYQSVAIHLKYVLLVLL